VAKKISSKDLNAGTDAFIKASSVLSPIQLKAWDDLGLTVTQLRLLYHLSQQDGMGNAELAARLNVTRPSISALLERLERNGFIRREISLADRRGIRILLEPAGREAINGAKDEVKKRIGVILGVLDEDQVKQVTDAFTLVATTAATAK
jgi:DNA-binding MarR family transcriptional regulator